MIEILKNALSITVFVTVMMLVIEYFNIKTKGSWSRILKKNKFLQVLLATILGIIPGCLGAYTVVSMYTHGILSFGALVASMIATFGDEAFLMFALIPSVTIKLTIVLVIISIITGVIVNIFIKNKKITKPKPLHIHENEKCEAISRQGIINNLKHISFVRAILIFSISVFLFFVITGNSGHSHSFNMDVNNNIEQEHVHDNSESCTHKEHNNNKELEKHDDSEHDSHNAWVKITFILILVVAFLIIISVPEHFLEEHLWNHVIKKHFLKIFIWTFGILLIVFFLKQYINVESYIADNLYIVLIVAVLVGIIPESGPHLIFVSLFISGTIPLSILLASSIVQDGHGALPLLAEDKKSFFLMKLINVAVGVLVGFVGIYMGF